MRRKNKNLFHQHPPAYALRPGPFRPYPACEGKISYYFLYEDGHLPNPDYAFFLQTQLLASKLLSGLAGYTFYGRVWVEASHQFSWEEIMDLAYWKDKKDIRLLSCETFGSQIGLQKFSFFTKNLQAVSQDTSLVPERILPGTVGICADYYAIRGTDHPTEAFRKNDGAQIEKSADFALIGDDTHGVWTISRTEKFVQNDLIESLEAFCKMQSSGLYAYI